MGKTSTEVKQRWIEKTYKRVFVNLRYDTDQEILDFLDRYKDKYGTTNIIRDALEMYMKSNPFETATECIIRELAAKDKKRGGTK